MPAFADNKNVMCYLNDIYVYLRARSTGVVGRGRPTNMRPSPPPSPPPRTNAWVPIDDQEFNAVRFEASGEGRSFRAPAHGLALVGIVLPGGAGAQDAQTEDSIELVDPHVFRACADPRDLPFSNQAGEGFENKIAELFARKLGKSVAYTFYPDATGFIRNTLNAHRCDVVLGIAQGDDIVQPTSPYYRTSYVAAYRKDGPLKGLDSLSDPRLKTAKIGIVAGTPPATVLAENGLLGNIKSYALVVDTRVDLPTRQMMEDLDHGDIDIALLWGPIAGYLRGEGEDADLDRPAREGAEATPGWFFGSSWG